MYKHNYYQDIIISCQLVIASSIIYNKKSNPCSIIRRPPDNGEQSAVPRVAEEVVLPGPGEAPSAHLLRAVIPKLRGPVVSALSLDNPRRLDVNNNVLDFRDRLLPAAGQKPQVANISHQLGLDARRDSRLPGGISRDEAMADAEGLELRSAEHEAQRSGERLLVLVQRHLQLGDWRDCDLLGNGL